MFPIPIRRRADAAAVLGVTLYTISGTVYDSDGTTAVESATIALGAYNTTSAANGTYTISGVPSGESGSMTCTKTGYSWTAITISAMAGNLTSQDYTNAWWAGGGGGALCWEAWKAKGAASLAASKNGLINSRNLSAGGQDPDFAAGTGWTFNGSDDYFSINSGTGPFSNNMSLVARITPSGSGTTRTLLGSATGYIFRLSTADKLQILNAANTVGTAGTAVSTDKVVAATYAGAGAYVFYLNGVADGCGTQNYDPGSDSDVLGAASGGADLYNGVIVALAVYTNASSVLTSTQIGIITTAMLAM